MFRMPPLKDLQTFPQRLRETGRIGAEWLRDVWELLFGPQPGLVLQDLLVRRRLGLAVAWLIVYGWATEALGVGYLLWPTGPPAAARLLNAGGFLVWVGLWMGLAALLQRRSRRSDWLGLCLLWSYTYLPVALLRGLMGLWQQLHPRWMELAQGLMVLIVSLGFLLATVLLLGRWVWLMREALAAPLPPPLRRQVRWQWPLLMGVGVAAGLSWRWGVCTSYGIDQELHQQLGRGDVTRMTVDLLTLHLRPPRPGEVIAFETLAPMMGPWPGGLLDQAAAEPSGEPNPRARPGWSRWCWQLGLNGYGGSRSIGRVTGLEPGGWVVVSSLAEPPGPERLRVPRERVIGKVVQVR